MCLLVATFVQYGLLLAGIFFLLYLSIVEIRYQNGECSLIRVNKSLLNSSSSPSSMIDSRLKLNHLTVLGTHNSYHRSNLIAPYEHPALDNQLGFGIRQIELDIHLMKNNLLVYHLQIFDDRTNCYCFKDCLKTISIWMNNNPSHSPIFLFIELKAMIYEDFLTGLTGGVKCQHFQEIQDEILFVFPSDHLILPGDIQGNQTSIRLALKQQRQDELSGDYSLKHFGWPSLSLSLGKILPVFLDDVHNRAKDLYSTCDPLQRFFLIAQNNINLPYSSIITISTISTNLDKLSQIANNGQITRLLLAYGTDHLIDIYQSSKQYGIHLISSDSLQCNDTSLCQAFNKDFQYSTILCNSFFAPPFCNSSTLYT